MKRLGTLLISFVVSVITAFIVTDAHNFANKTLDYFKITSQDTRRLILSALTTLIVGLALWLIEKILKPGLSWISKYFKRSNFAISIFSHSTEVDKLNFRAGVNGEYENKKIQIQIIVEHRGWIAFHLNRVCKTKLIFVFEPECYMDIVEETTDQQLFCLDEKNNIVIDCFSNFSFVSDELKPMVSIDVRFLPKRVAAATVFCDMRCEYQGINSKIMRSLLDKTINIKMMKLQINCEGMESDG